MHVNHRHVGNVCANKSLVGYAAFPHSSRTELPRSNQPRRDERPAHVAQNGQDPKKHGQRPWCRRSQPAGSTAYDGSRATGQTLGAQTIHEDAPLIQPRRVLVAPRRHEQQREPARVYRNGHPERRC